MNAENIRAMLRRQQTHFRRGGIRIEMRVRFCEEAFPGRSDKNGIPSEREIRCVQDQLHRLLGGGPETDPGIDDDVVLPDTGIERFLDEGL